MASLSTNVAQAKLRNAGADAVVAAAELKAARASALVAEAELEMAEALKDCNTSAPWFNVETPNVLSSSLACGPRSGSMSPRPTQTNPWLDMVTDSGPSAAEGSTWGEQIASTLSASAAVAGKTACRAGPVASGSGETDQAGPFLQFGRRLRLRSCVFVVVATLAVSATASPQILSGFLFGTRRRDSVFDLIVAHSTR